MESPLSSHTIQCSCGSASCTLHYKLWLPHGALKDPALYLELSIAPVPKFWDRVVRGLKYILFGSDCAYLGFEHVYDGKGAKEQRALLDRFITEWDKYYGETK